MVHALIVRQKMKKPNTSTLLALLAGIFVASCNDRKEVEATQSATEEKAEENASASNPEWDAKLTKVATMMKEQKEAKDLIDYVRSAAVNADTVYPYLQSVMAGDAEEDKKSASLFLFTAGYMLVSNGHANVPDKARAYIDSLEGGSKSAEKLLEDQDLVPTYKNYRYTIDK